MPGALQLLRQWLSDLARPRESTTSGAPNIGLRSIFAGDKAGAAGFTDG
jgi:hypothetical protein